MENTDSTQGLLDVEKLELHPENIYEWSQSPTNYVFLVPDIATGRAIALNAVRAVPAWKAMISQVETRLADPKPINDLRIDGMDTSYSEIPPDNFGPPRSPAHPDAIKCTFYLRDFADRADYQERLALGMQPMVNLLVQKNVSAK